MKVLVANDFDHAPWSKTEKLMYEAVIRSVFVHLFVKLVILLRGS